jgi:feruloyl esterase
MYRCSRVVVVCLAVAALGAAHARATQMPCEALLHADFENVPEAATQVVSAQKVGDSAHLAGTDYQPQALSGTPLAGTGIKRAADLPAYCRFVGNIAPQIMFELRLPTTGWNHKLLMQGCGGMCGIINMEAAEDALIRGYAVVNTNMGHSGSAAITNWGTDRLLRIDFGWRATHVVALAATEVTTRFYGEAPRYRYFRGYSTGGDQALAEAQRFPGDFDGIISGAPVSGGAFPLVWSARQTLSPTGVSLIDPAKIPMIHAAVMKACGGTPDNFLEDPTRCTWQPSSLHCSAGNQADCLTDAEVGVLTRLYTGARDAYGHAMSMGMARGSELEWVPLYVAPGKPTPWSPDGTRPIWLSYVAATVLRNVELWTDPGPSLDLLTFDVAGFYQTKKVTDPFRFDLNPDLREFQEDGGKLLIFQGWNDPEVQPFATLDYFKVMTRTMGGEAATSAFCRLFMVPGMAHTRGGEGADAIDYLAALENWVEHKQAPDSLLSYHLRTPQTYMGLPVLRYPLAASRYDWTRPIFAYPHVAAWDGKGARGDPNAWHPAPAE